MSEVDKIKSLRPKANELGVSTTILYFLTALQTVKVELRNLIYARTTRIIIDSGTYTTIGGSTTETIDIDKACEAKQIHVTMNKQGLTPVTILEANCSNGAVTVKFSADPSNDHILNYTLIK